MWQGELKDYGVLLRMNALVEFGMEDIYSDGTEFEPSNLKTLNNVQEDDHATNEDITVVSREDGPSHATAVKVDESNSRHAGCYWQEQVGWCVITKG